MIKKIKKLKNFLPLLIIVLLGLILRTFGLNWDQGAFLHPDERFLVMVSQSLKTPAPRFSYFDPDISSFNPVNTGHEFYVYGVFPVVIHKLLGDWLLPKVGFLEATLLGRTMSAITDTLIIVLIYKIVELLEKSLGLKSKTKLWAALIYALMVLPIQTAHFFTVDPFLNFFSLLGIYFSLKFLNFQKYRQIILSGLAFSLAMAAKISAIYPMALSLLIITWVAWKNAKFKFSFKKFIIPLMKYLSFFFLVAYLGLRIFNPGYFANFNIFQPSLSLIFIDNIKMLSAWSKPDTWFPPAIQWLNKPWWFAGKNIIFYGIGLPISTLILIGGYGVMQKFWTSKKLKKSGLWLIGLWLIGFIIWQSLQFAKTMRYFLIIYPWFAIAGAIGVEHVKKHLSKNRFFINICLIVFISTWPLAFLNIYTQNHSRVQASIWLENNLPVNTVILSEYWDDALPISRNFRKNKNFRQIELHVFDQDSPKKWLKLEQQLDVGEYYALSSNRAWESIGNNPDRYPQMSKFYSELFNDELNYKLEKKFEVYPSLRWLGIPLDFNDSEAEEAFTVYDHPTVMIFKKD